MADHHPERLLYLDKGALRHLLDGARALAEDALAFRDAVLEVALALAELLRRDAGTLVGELLLLFAPVVLLALEVLVETLAPALDLLAHLVEGRGVTLDLRNVHDADHRRRRRLARRQGRHLAAGGGLRRTLLLLGALLLLLLSLLLGRALPLALALARHEPFLVGLGGSGAGGEDGADDGEPGAAGCGGALC